MEIYLDFLENGGIKLNKTLIKKFKIKVKQNKILIYTGFSNEPWNITYSETHALGGSEKAVINLSKELSKFYKIDISGDVLEETVGDITFINRFNLKNVNYKIIIVSRYVSFGSTPPPKSQYVYLPFTQYLFSLPNKKYNFSL